MYELPSNVCPQCGLMHPPLPQGAECPMANKGKDLKTEEIDGLTNFFSSLKNILRSNISEDEKNTKKIFSDLLLLIQIYFDNKKKEK